jgi:Restriction Endonuclease associating with ARP
MIRIEKYGAFMSYREDERKRAIEIRDAVFRDPGAGLYSNIEREFVLQDQRLNLWAGIRDDVLDYFEKNHITWWMGDKTNEPTGHLLSSQIACLNHLYFARQRKDAATAILKGVSDKIEEAVTVDDGYVEFEAIGKETYLRERSHTRGANCTSVDAIMVGKKNNESNILFLIEWKYTEEYREENKYIPERYEIYDELLKEDGCPIGTKDFESLYYEPFYQLMRQTLLGWKMVQAGEYQCDEYIHLHVIPAGNVELRERITSPNLRSRGGNMSDAWKSVLREPERYIVISPEKFTEPAFVCPDTKSIMTYLQKRYWNMINCLSSSVYEDKEADERARAKAKKIQAAAEITNAPPQEDYHSRK